jgi:hypothetical protein
MPECSLIEWNWCKYFLCTTLMLQIMNTTLLLQIIHFSNNGLGCWFTDFDEWLRKLYKLMGSYCSNWSNIYLDIQWCFLIVCVQHMQNTVECYYISILVSGNKWHIAVKHSNSKIPLLFNMIQCNRMNQSKDDLLNSTFRKIPTQNVFKFVMIIRHPFFFRCKITKKFLSCLQLNRVL